eukprot:TRINITY_DN7473_c0_g1_i1.p2 TRINITY_DN7473_c0_g1~~TRINITY_DN7473_c0_g1_i1.p2  ORF type:complete len:181 (-),score=44.14 TRINITY_DN7473_c0_g1_i1:174-716(-)
MGSAFFGIEWPALILLTWAVDWAEREHSLALWPASLPADMRLRSPPSSQDREERLRLDLFVWLGWDTDKTDVDLHVVEPSGEEIMYNHNRSQRTGAHLTRDFTEGYGPECYLCPRAEAGAYAVAVNYYGTHQDSLTTGATSTVIWRVQHMGDPKREQLAFSTQRLSGTKEKETVLTMQFP